METLPSTNPNTATIDTPIDTSTTTPATPHPTPHIPQLLLPLLALLCSDPKIDTATIALAARARDIINKIELITEQNPDYITPQAIAPLLNLLSSATPSLLEHFIAYLETALGHSTHPPPPKEIVPSDATTHIAPITVPTLSSNPQAAGFLLSVTDRISVGIRSFLARGGRTAIPPPLHDDTSEPLPKRRKGSSSRSSQQRSRCLTRDKKFCIVTGSPDNLEVAHILPFSIGVTQGVRSSSGSSLAGPPVMDTCFWGLVEMFLGQSSMAALRERFAKLDAVENMLLLSGGVHAYFGAGRIALIPQINGSDFDSSMYLVTVDFPKHKNKGVPAIAKEPTSPTSRTMERIFAGDMLTLRTDDCSVRPLTHPALLALHALISRVVAARGAIDVAVDKAWDDYSDTELSAGGEQSSYNDSDDDIDDGDSKGSGNEKEGWVSQWVERTSPPIQVYATPLSQDFDNGERPRAVEAVMGEGAIREVERRIMLV